MIAKLVARNAILHLAAPIICSPQKRKIQSRLGDSVGELEELEGGRGEVRLLPPFLPDVCLKIYLGHQLSYCVCVCVTTIPFHDGSSRALGLNLSPSWRKKGNCFFFPN